jgi:hypothetical protein
VFVVEETTQTETTQGSVIAPRRFKMLSVASRMRADRHQYVNGFKNIAYLVGYARHINKDGFFLQMRNSENLMIPVHFQMGRKMPRGFSEKDPVKVYARINTRIDQDKRYTRLEIVRIDRPNVLELPGAAAFMGEVHEQSTEDPEFKPYGAGNAASKACNQVILAGYLAGYDIRLQNAHEGGQYSKERLIIHLRQSANPAESIPVRIYGEDLGRVTRRLRNGMALMFWGDVKTELVPTGEKNPENGKDIVTTQPFIKASYPELANETDILFLNHPDMTPKWARELASSAKARPARSVAGSEKDMKIENAQESEVGENPVQTTPVASRPDEDLATW